MPATVSKPTSAELDQAKRIYSDVNDFLEYLSETIQSELEEELSESEESDDEEELSPIVSQFLREYKEYKTSIPQIHSQLLPSDSSNSSFTSSDKSSRIPKRFWKYSNTYQQIQLLSPELLSHPKLCDTKLDCSVPVSPLFSSTFPIPDQIGNEKLLTNGTPSVSLLKAQLEKIARKEQEELKKNCIIIRSPIYTPIREKKFIFVVEKSSDVILAPQIVEPPKQQDLVKEETTIEKNSTIEDEKSELVSEILSEKKPKKNTIDFDFLSNFLSITKVGFSRSQLRTLVWA